ncbi:uncharacterized protein N7515_003769 [Penicillium bovifimosum]|uniref:Tse2 ADP-ribosyltransferase toxin domain-containing protein n=1 Tax=Penicillium bovifimosum TaxID=126998 RepID=A0A9W9H741_9EURO|nr:uncharacterized protein N7515_003769 [Penicillium bovifimosum]KAJ5138921.1 hypothetical protein N7515_003769 [Penicillium bovifimosum]
MSKNRYIQSFTRFPNELFRVNYGASVRLRAHPGPVRPLRNFDLLTTAGKVQPKALNPASYEFPNGASMRPNTTKQQNLVRTSRDSPAFTVYIYAVPADALLPDDLILVHEFGDHFSLQARVEMTVEGNINL